MTLRLVTYGGFSLIARDGRRVRLRGQKAEAMFTYLALTNGIERDTARLALWGLVHPRAGRHSVSHTISQLWRQLSAFHSAPVITTADQITLAPALVQVDLRSVERLVQRNTLHSLTLACRMCRGDFLSGMSLDAPDVAAWFTTLRVRAHAAAFEAYWRHATLAMAVGRTVDALMSAFRLIELDALDERGHLLLMRLYAAHGQVGTALDQYDIYAQLRDTAVHAEPGTAMQTLRGLLLDFSRALLPPAVYVRRDHGPRRSR
jgi:DNA-binding SARP family transcriptional activator